MGLLLFLYLCSSRMSFPSSAEHEIFIFLSTLAMSDAANVVIEYQSLRVSSLLRTLRHIKGFLLTYSNCINEIGSKDYANQETKDRLRFPTCSSAKPRDFRCDRIVRRDM